MERGRVLKCVLRVRGPAQSTTTTGLAGGAADGKPGEGGGHSWPGAGRGAVGSGDRLRYSCFSVWQLSPTTSALEKGYPRRPASPFPRRLAGS